MVKKKKLGIIIITFISLSFLLYGCSKKTNPTTHYFGFIYHYLAIPTQHILSQLAKILGGSYGWSIILITIIVRILLMPLMLNQMKKSTIQQEKIMALKPQMDSIKKQMQSTKTQEEQLILNQKLMSLYKDNEISMIGGIGCLPLLIQMPIFAALYTAIQYSPDLKNSTFFGINLAQRSFTFVILTFLIYALQGWLSTKGIPKKQSNSVTTGMMMIYTPVMFSFMTWISPAGLGLYFFAGGIIACLQTLLINSIRPKIRKEIELNLKKPIKSNLNNEEVHVKKVKANISQRHNLNRQRNMNKQNHK